MKRCIRELAAISAEPFVALVRSSLVPPVTTDMEGRRLAVMRLLRREWPSRLDELQQELREHPDPQVRSWWLQHLQQQGRELVVEVNPRDGLDMVLVPAGSFDMGSAPPEGDRDEHPVHEVTLEPFYMARAPVTNAQYAQYLEANPTAQAPKFWGNPLFNRPNQPVVGISWYEAQAYCDWAELELPTEAQWEYACRAGTTTRFCSGSTKEDLERVAWCFGNSDDRLHDVGMKPHNDFGLVDMHGNVWEWCRDAHARYHVAPRPVDGLRYEPIGDAKRTRRGGGFRSLPSHARSAIRGYWRPGERHDDLGFRPVRNIRGSGSGGSGSGAADA